ncbi:antitoxin [Alterisphingorhabdus coralli]|uniref:Antitoxin n=1 Tax=Alterisphingorhabdus coralli TaxID=3071408 RepID=A0AA97F7N2_9SPHN|nr:antitoxin [Parasphingorhabdus sp. SCSIO 66989]WOE74592.1 antitoxin [Parasphingorhabdus sp. SCSIO 66989]
MVKPKQLSGYDHRVTEACERVLVTLLRGLGPYKESVYLVGGLVPHYIVRERPPKVPAHAGTGDVDIVIDLALLTNVDAYRTLEENLHSIGFARAENDNGVKRSWQWQIEVEEGLIVLLEFLTEGPEGKAGVAEPLPSDGNVSAIHIPHASIIPDFYEETEITAELLGGDGISAETIKFANIVGFTCLKAFAFEQRNERKDAHDLVYCFEHMEGAPDAVIKQLAEAMQSRHADVLAKALDMLEKRFCDGEVEGYLKDGPVAVAKFELGENLDEEMRNQLILRQRNVSEIVSKLVLGVRDNCG